MAMMIAQAAAQVPARNGNIWDGKAHQPDRADTAAAEHAAGVQPSAARRARLDEELEATCHRLMQGDPDRSC